jgi:lambda family phage portal protein
MAPPFLQRAQQALAWAIMPETFARRYDGATSRNGDRNARFSTYAAETPAASPRIRDKSRYYTENNAYYGAAVRALSTNLVGAGVVPASTHPDAAVQTLLAERWADFDQTADHDQLTNLGGLQSAIVTDMIRDGEGLALMRNGPGGLRVQRLASEMLDDTKTADLGNGAHIASGVEFDGAGNRVAYWIFPHAPSNTSAASIQSVRVDAQDVIHIFEQRGAGQVRGVPWGASAITRISDIDQTEAALLAGNKIAAMNCGFIYDEFGAGGNPFGEGEQDGDVKTVSLEPATVQRLGPGQKIVFNTPQQSAQGVEFLASQLRAVASSFGVPPALIDSDYSKANYSSLRASLVTYAARLDQIVHTLLVPQLLNHIWRRWITTEILAGRIEAKDFESNASVWFGVEWFAPAPPVADEIKTAQADAVQIKAGLKSRAQAIRERGYSPQALDAERANDAEREQTLGLQSEGAPAEQEEDSND